MFTRRFAPEAMFRPQIITSDVVRNGKSLATQLLAPPDVFTGTISATTAPAAAA